MNFVQEQLKICLILHRYSPKLIQNVLFKKLTKEGVEKKVLRNATKLLAFSQHLCVTIIVTSI